MYLIEARNVNRVYAELVRLVRRGGVEQPSRAGQVLALPAPVMLVTHRPTERVLLDERRDANPFFHLFESLFLLAGRDDYTWLDRFVRNFSSSFGEADGRGHGSYGQRWRSHFGFDQLDVVVEKLRADPCDRRVVISMWDPSAYDAFEYQGEGDYQTVRDAADDLRGSFADHPCNTHIYPRIVNNTLDLTVCCRSNDAIWGAAGANAVQFSMLLEYLAGRVGVGVGRLYQLANNCHAYTARLDRYGEPEMFKYGPDPYHDLSPTSIGTDWDHWDEDLRMFMEWTDNEDLTRLPVQTNLWFHQVVHNMWLAHGQFVKDKTKMPVAVSAIAAPDWRLSCEQWIKRRMK